MAPRSILIRFEDPQDGNTRQRQFGAPASGTMSLPRQGLAYIGSLLRALTDNRFPPARRTWDGMYRDKEPDRYRNLEQFARYAVIEGYCKSLPRPFSLLEVGCGAGILLSRLDTALIAHYVGLDVSSLALDEARITYPNGTYVHSYAEAFSSDADRFDVIIFNESIYYLHNLVTQFNRYLSFLTPGGYAIVSITHLCPDPLRLFEEVFSKHIVSQTVVTDTRSAKAWSVYLVSKEPSL